MANARRFGRGLTFPLRRNGAGTFANAAGSDKLANNVELILGTRADTERVPGEVPWRPDFGSRLAELKHSRSRPATIALARFYVVDAIDRWEPRVQPVETEIVASPVGGGAELVVRTRLSVTDDAEGIEQVPEVSITI